MCLHLMEHLHVQDKGHCIVFVILGLVDTAVKTAETGYMQRRLVKVCKHAALVFFYVHMKTVCVYWCKQ